MSRIRSKNTAPELKVRSWLHKKGFRFRVHRKNLPGKPDIVLPKYRSVIFTHGCFWHGHKGCKNFKIPKTRTEWWKEKFRKNRDNDRKTVRELKKAGWNVYILWECEIKSEEFPELISDICRSMRNESE